MSDNGEWFGTVTADVAFDPTISPAARSVYLVLVMYRNREDDTCFPSNETLMRNSGLSRATVKRALADLTEHGIIERIPRFKDGRQTTSVTRLVDASAKRKRLR